MQWVVVCSVDVVVNNTYPEVIVDSIDDGFRVSAVIKNIGTGAAVDVGWSIDLSGWCIILAGQHSEGVIPRIGPGESVTVRQTTLYGIGLANIVVAADVSSLSASGLVLGPLVIGLSL